MRLATVKQQIGATAELLAMAEYAKRGYAILTSMAPERYDFVAEKEGKFIRVQVKHGYREQEDRFLTSRVTNPYLKDEIDVLAIKDPASNDIYYVNAEDIEGSTNVKIRLEPLKVNLRQQMSFNAAECLEPIA
jgi:hypothetical protein